MTLRLVPEAVKAINKLLNMQPTEVNELKKKATEALVALLAEVNRNDFVVLANSALKTLNELPIDTADLRERLLQAVFAKKSLSLSEKYEIISIAESTNLALLPLSISTALKTIECEHFTHPADGGQKSMWRKFEKRTPKVKESNLSDEIKSRFVLQLILFKKIEYDLSDESTLLNETLNRMYGNQLDLLDYIWILRLAKYLESANERLLLSFDPFNDTYTPDEIAYILDSLPKKWWLTESIAIRLVEQLPSDLNGAPGECCSILNSLFILKVRLSEERFKSLITSIAQHEELSASNLAKTLRPMVKYKLLETGGLETFVSILLLVIEGICSTKAAPQLTIELTLKSLLEGEKQLSQSDMAKELIEILILHLAQNNIASVSNQKLLVQVGMTYRIGQEACTLALYNFFNQG